MGEDPTVDPAREMVEQVEARLQFAASARVAKFSDDMWRVLLDLQKR
jgi:flagellar hook protein FlgE